MKNLLVICAVAVVVLGGQAYGGLLYSADYRISVHPSVQGGVNLPMYSVDWGEAIALPIPNGYTGNNGYISADGRVISGNLINYDENNNILTDMRGAIWEQTQIVNGIPYYSQARLLPSLEAGQSNLMCDMSSDGQYLAGTCILANETGQYQGVYWDENRNIHSLGGMYYDSLFFNHSCAGYIRDDKTVFGITWVDEGGGPVLAFVWNEQHGMRYLKDVLEQEYGYDFGDAILTSINFLDPYGTNIYGLAYDATGEMFHWSATTPEPATILLLGLGGLFLRKCRR